MTTTTTTTAPTGAASTPERLARVLDAAGLPDMAQAARTGLYDEWRSELVDPRERLIVDLMGHGRLDLAARAQAREFDPTPEETRAWLDSDHGRTVLGQLDAGAYDDVLRTVMRGGLPLPDDMMHGLVARHVSRCTAPAWTPPAGCDWRRHLGHDAVHAVWHLARQSGCRAFQVTHTQPHRPEQKIWQAGWTAAVTYPNGLRLTVEGYTPADAADQLATRILVGARCAGCNRPAGLTLTPGRCRWRRYGPRWVGACGAAL